MKRLITILGWAFFGLFLACGLVAWASLPPRVSVVLGHEQEAAAESPELERLQGIVLDLEERVEELEATADAIVTEVGRRGEATARAEGTATKNGEALADLRARTAGLERQTDTIAKLLTGLVAAREAALAAAPAVTGGASTPEAIVGAGVDALVEEPSTETPPPPTEPAKVVATERPPGLEATAAPAEEPTSGVGEAIGFGELMARRRWRLWDEATTFRLVTPESQVGFEGSSTVHDFAGSTHDVSGSLRFVFADPTSAPEAQIVVDARTLDTENEDRDAEMHEEHLQSAQYPTMTFTLKSVRDARTEAGGDELSATAAGTFEIHGRQRDVELPVKIAKRPGRRILVEGECPLKMSDFGIEPPTALGGVIKTSDDVLVKVRLEAEAVKP